MLADRLPKQLTSVFASRNVQGKDKKSKKDRDKDRDHNRDYDRYGDRSPVRLGAKRLCAHVLEQPACVHGSDMVLLFYTPSGTA